MCRAVVAATLCSLLCTSVFAADAPKRWGVLEQYCFDCHNTTDWSGGIAFDAMAPDSIASEQDTWEKAVRKLRTGLMPPAGKSRPDRATLDGLADELAVRLDESAHAHPYPGATSIHRLNRTEYANVIRDLLAYPVDVTTLLPADNATEGFDNIADVLSVSPTLVQSYIAAAMKISRAAVGDRTMAPTLTKYAAPRGQNEHIEGLPLGTRGGTLVSYNAPLDAEYEIRVATGNPFRFLGDTGRAAAPSVDVTVNGESIKVDDPRKFRIRLKAGPQTLGFALIDHQHATGADDLYAQAFVLPPTIDNVVINGPFDAVGAGDTPSRRAIFICQPQDSQHETPCARQILTRLATRAYRRPVQPDEAAVETLMRFYEAGRREGGDFESGIRRGLARILSDTQFLYRTENERPDLAEGSIYRISDVELASRLSFFLWSSIPDDTLVTLAAQGKLSQPKTLEQQVRRMLADPKSEALVDNFAGQWLRLRELKNAQPADRDFDDNLREALEQETQMLFASVMREDRSFLDLLDADYTFLNERLAHHYGIENIRGSYMRRVSLAKSDERRGILGQGSILTVTSAGDRTSPVQRGAWVMETLMGAPPPRPPPGVEQDLKQDPNAPRPTTVRERLERHRADKSCAACHAVIDPIGFSLEHFDLDGRWRDHDGGAAVDAHGTLVDGTQLNGVQDLRRALLSRPEVFVTSGTEKMLMYALGRRLEAYDQPTVRKIVSDAARDHYRFTSIVLGIVNSLPFQMRVRGK